MPPTVAVYLYKALAGTADVSGTISADTPRQAREQLRDRGLVVRDVADYRPPRAARRGAGRSSLAARSQTTTLIRELATLLGVGVPLLEALDTVARQHAGRARSAVLLLRDHVAGGGGLAGGMRRQPRTFDDLAVHIAEVGEDAGSLDVALARLAAFRERSDAFKNRLATALIYPAVVSVVGVCSAVFLMTFVVPKILQPLVEQDLPLPWPTRVVQWASDGLLGWWWLLAGVAVGVTVAASAAVNTARGRLAWHRLLLRTPVLGGLVLKQAIVRVAVVLGTLLRSGVVFVRALQVAGGTTDNLPVRHALAEVERAVVAGGDIAAALDRTAVFPPLVVHLLALGQQSGRLEEMLDQLAAAYEQQVATDAARLAAVVEPAMIVVLAGFVLFIVLATVLPILEVGNAIQ